MTDLNLIADAASLKKQAKHQGRPLQRVLYDVLRTAISKGQLQPGAVLPSSRTLAQELKMARNGVLYAYEQLSAEGYLVADRRGTCVAASSARLPVELALKRRDNAMPSLARRTAPLSRVRSVEADRMPLVPGMPALDEFPLGVWQKLCINALKETRTDELGYRFNNGEWELRQAIATYLSAARGLKCTAEQVTITDGTQHSLALCAWMLADEGDTAWIEDPGYGGAFAALYQAGLEIHPVPVDQEGISPTDKLWKEKPPKVIYTTPSHQFPMGSVLSLQRRLQLIHHAKLNNSWILEDDYDSEFRHEGAPLCAMQGQVEEAPVIYLGTFSKSMFPALRLGYIVWPRKIADRATEVLGEIERRGRPFEQRAMATFINEGYFTSHLRKMRKLYRLRRDALFSALQTHWPLPVTLFGGQAGMHLTVSLPEHSKRQVYDTSLVEAAVAKGVFPRPLSIFIRGNYDVRNGLVMGYANTNERRIEQSIKKLALMITSSTPP